MTLTEGIYEIDKEYKAFIVERGTKVKIVRRAKVLDNSPRCRDCKHCKVGKYAFSPNQWWESEYCDAKPKTIGGDNRFFYSTFSSHHTCEKFEPKKTNYDTDRTNTGRD